MRDFKWRALRMAALIVLVTMTLGCVSMQQMQDGMDEIDSVWGGANNSVLASQGSKTYSINTSQCLRAARDSALQLGFSIIKESDTSLLAKAPTPHPFTKKEFQDIKDIEEPMMQAIAANHVGKFASNYYYLDGKGGFFVILMVEIVRQARDEYTLVKVSFKIEPKTKIKGFIYGQNPPPEAVKKGLEKWWDAFDSNLAKIVDPA